MITNQEPRKDENEPTNILSQDESEKREENSTE